MTFPATPLDLRTELELTSGGWADVSTYVYQRQGDSPPVTLTRGRQDESTQATASSANFELNNRDGRFSPQNAVGPYYGQLGRNTPVRFSVPAKTTYLRTEDDVLSGASCPDATPLRISGDLDVRVDVRFTDWAGAGQNVALNLVGSNWGVSGNVGWLFGLTSAGTGQLVLNWSPDGTATTFVKSTIPVPVVGRIQLRATLQVSTGTVTFYTATSGDVTHGPWTQLGSPVAAGATTLHAATGGLKLNGPIFNAGYYGATYAAQVRAGISGTVVAFPDFTAQSAGTTSFADAEGNTWTLQGAASIDDRNYRYYGEMSSIPGKWDATGADISVPAQAGGLLRRISQGQAPVMSPMKRGILLQQGALSPVQYWPMEDAGDATQFGSATGGPPLLISGSPQLASNSSFNSSLPLPATNGGLFRGVVPSYPNTGTLVFRFLMDLGSTQPTLSTGWPLVRLVTSGTCQHLDFKVYSGDAIGMAGVDVNGNSVFDSGPVAIAGTPNGTMQGQPTWASMELRPASPGSATINWAFVLIFPGDNVGQQFTGSFQGTAGTVRQVIFNGTQLPDTAVGHASVQSAWTSMFSLGGPLDAWQGETAAYRFARLCGENSLQARVIGAPASSAVMGPQAIDTLGNLLQACEDADRGQIFEPRTQLALGYRTLASMASQPVKGTLDYSLSQPGGTQGSGDSELSPTFDDQLLRNDWTLTRSAGNVSGGTYQYQLDDGSSMSVSQPPDGVGDYADTLSVGVAYDEQLPDIAGWMVHVGTVDEARWPGIPVNLARSALASLYYQLLDVDIGDYVQILHLINQVSYDPVKQLTWQVTEALGGFHHTLVWTGVPESPYETGIVGDAVHGRVDTDGSSLAAAASASLMPDPFMTQPSAWAPVNGGHLSFGAAPASGGPPTWVTVTGAAGSSFGVSDVFASDPPVTSGEKLCAAALVYIPEGGTARLAIGWTQSGGSYSESAVTATVPAGVVTPIALGASAAPGAGVAGPYVTRTDSGGTSISVSAFLLFTPVSVATDAGFPVWTTAAADFPFDVNIGGERITVTGITGSSSPQAFTVARGVNGICKALPGGSDVRLWQPSYLAIT